MPRRHTAFTDTRFRVMPRFANANDFRQISPWSARRCAAQQKYNNAPVTYKQTVKPGCVKVQRRCTIYRSRILNAKHTCRWSNAPQQCTTSVVASNCHFWAIYSSRETKSTATIIPTKSQATRLRLNYTMTGNSSIYWTAKTCSTLSAQSSTMQTFVMAEIHVRIEEMEN